MEGHGRTQKLQILAILCSKIAKNAIFNVQLLHNFSKKMVWNFACQIVWPMSTNRWIFNSNWKLFGFCGNLVLLPLRVLLLDLIALLGSHLLRSQCFTRLCSLKSIQKLSLCFNLEKSIQLCELFEIFKISVSTTK